MIDETTIRQQIIAIDYGEKRVGVAHKPVDSSDVQILPIIANDGVFWDNLGRVMDDFRPDVVVIGRPRGLDGEETAQTEVVKKFAEEFCQHFDTEVVLQDETLSSHEAETRLPKNTPIKQRRKLLDSIAAQIILEDYIS